jgi:hypothetical protein
MSGSEIKSGHLSKMKKKKSLSRSCRDEKSTLLNIPRNTSVNHSLTCEIAGMDANKGPHLLASSFYPRKRQNDELFSCSLCHHSALKLISRRDYGAVTMSLNVLFYGKGFSLVISWLFNRQVAMELAHSSPTTGHNSEQVQCHSNSSNPFPAQFCHPAPYPIDIVICFLGGKVDGG